MKNPVKLPALAGFVAFALAASPAIAGDNPKVADEVIALARAQWAAEIAGKPVSAQIESLAEDYTEINNDVPIRIDGKAANARYYEALGQDGSKPLAADMANAKVQVYGDTAILTYNYIGVTLLKDGKAQSNNAVSTRVYSRINGKWMLVHAHFTAVK